MWIQTHAHLAKMIHQHMKNKYKVDLDLEWLQYGSIYPDLAWCGMRRSHLYKEDYSFFMGKLIELVEESKRMDIKKFSFQLGILHHFIADFFCGAHNDESMIKNLWPHFCYEIRLHHEFVSLWPDTAGGLMAQSPGRGIPVLHRKYLDSIQDINNDMRYITQCCLGLTEYFVKQITRDTAKIA